MNTRQEFEAWYSDGGQAPRSIEKNDLGNYLLSNTYLAWMAWQAATSRQEAKIKALVDALEYFDNLIEHQYTGSREAMSALQHASNLVVTALATAKETP